MFLIYENFANHKIIHLLLVFNSLNAKLPPYRNQSIDLQSKSMYCFLYDENFGF